ncbi:MAG TPA: OsmC family protein [Vicinamibacterales bacterium]|nr:OsmC family protein [Vicinamibacterales bacterium]
MADVFRCQLDWSGAAKGATRDAAAFSRDLDVMLGAIALPMSAAPSFRGDATRANPEQLFVAALSACQALTYLFLAAKHGVVVTAYRDEAEGRLGVVEGRMRVSRVVLRPHVTLADRSNEPKARELVEKAHHDCFIANSTTTPVQLEPVFEFGETRAT